VVVVADFHLQTTPTEIKFEQGESFGFGHFEQLSGNFS
jgi:hypothetical protein